MKEKLKLFVCMCFSIVCLVSALTIEAAQVPLDSVIRTSQKVAGVFIIQEAQGRKAIHLQWLGNSDHKTLIMNKKDQLDVYKRQIKTK